MPAKHAKIRENKNLGNDSARWSNLVASASQKKNTAENAEDRRGFFGGSRFFSAPSAVKSFYVHDFLRFCGYFFGCGWRPR